MAPTSLPASGSDEQNAPSLTSPGLPNICGSHSPICSLVPLLATAVAATVASGCARHDLLGPALVEGRRAGDLHGVAPAAVPLADYERLQVAGRVGVVTVGAAGAGRGARHRVDLTRHALAQTRGDSAGKSGRRVFVPGASRSKCL